MCIVYFILYLSICNTRAKRCIGGWLEIGHYKKIRVLDATKSFPASFINVNKITFKVKFRAVVPNVCFADHKRSATSFQGSMDAFL
jgi:hypothetical protein